MERFKFSRFFDTPGAQWVVDLEKAIGNLRAPKVEDGKEMENGGHLVYGKMGPSPGTPSFGSKSQVVKGGNLRHA